MASSDEKVKPKGKVFRDPIHRLIRIDPRDAYILELIDTPEFQRLRRVRQLGVSNLTYHGAEHTRFAHSLGVFNFAQRILDSLLRRYRSNKHVLDYLEAYAPVAKAAALLHDVGHGPFSHMIERAFDNSRKHEEMTIESIKGEQSSIPAILTNHNIQPEAVADIIRGTSQHQLIQDIISSQLDADRMDYLLRDSMFTGVEYGRYDAEWLLSNLCIGRDPNASADQNETGWRLCLDRERGLHTTEQLILARMHMFVQVYMHRVTRGYEMLLLNLFRQAAKAVVEDMPLPKGTPECVQHFFERKGQLPPDQWLRFDEGAMLAAITAWAESSDSAHEDIRQMADAYLLRKRFYQASLLDSIGLRGDSFRLAADLSRIAPQGLAWEIDDGGVLPYKGVLYGTANRRSDSEEMSVESILLSSGELDEPAQPAESLSPVLKTLDDAPHAVSRLYFRRDRKDEFEPILERYTNR